LLATAEKMLQASPANTLQPQAPPPTAPQPEAPQQPAALPPAAPVPTNPPPPSQAPVAVVAPPLPTPPEPAVPPARRAPARRESAPPLQKQPDESRTANYYYAQGRVQSEQEKFEDAIKSFDRALQIEPNYALAFNARGYAYLRLRYYESAVADFSKAIRLNPNYANAYWNRSAVKKAAGDNAGAREDMRRALQLEGALQRGLNRPASANKQ
jgi:tetratricopeptide (TPR) repeat protein